MKPIKKSLISVLAVAVLMLCILFSACADAELVENNRTGQSTVGVYSSMLSIKQYGIPFQYEFKNAEIETIVTTGDGGIVVVQDGDVLNDWVSLPDNPYDGEVKLASRDYCPLKTYYLSSFQWAPAQGWMRGEGVVEDYITFIARKENHIVGFAVLYVCSDGFKGGGEVFADKEFPKVDGKYQKVSEDTVNRRIQEVIDAHKNYVEKIRDKILN